MDTFGRKVNKIAYAAVGTAIRGKKFTDRAEAYNYDLELVDNNAKRCIEDLGQYVERVVGYRADSPATSREVCDALLFAKTLVEDAFMLSDLAGRALSEENYKFVFGYAPEPNHEPIPQHLPLGVELIATLSVLLQLALIRETEKHMKRLRKTLEARNAELTVDHIRETGEIFITRLSAVLDELFGNDEDKDEMKKLVRAGIINGAARDHESWDEYKTDETARRIFMIPDQIAPSVLN